MARPNQDEYQDLMVSGYLGAWVLVMRKGQAVVSVKCLAAMKGRDYETEDRWLKKRFIENLRPASAKIQANKHMDKSL